MHPAYEDVLRAMYQARRALRRGDLEAAERWYRVVRTATAVAKNMTPALRLAAEQSVKSY